MIFIIGMMIFIRMAEFIRTRAYTYNIRVYVYMDACMLKKIYVY